MASVWVEPDHPATRFRAYNSLNEGAADYVEFLHRRFSRAWPFVVAGDPVGFVHALKVQGYFTADEAQYTSSVKSIFSKLKATLELNRTSLPVLSKGQTQELFDLVELTAQEMSDEALRELRDGRGNGDD